MTTQEDFSSSITIVKHLNIYLTKHVLNLSEFMPSVELWRRLNTHSSNKILWLNIRLKSVIKKFEVFQYRIQYLGEVSAYNVLLGVKTSVFILLKMNLIADYWYKGSRWNQNIHKCSSFKWYYISFLWK